MKKKIFALITAVGLAVAPAFAEGTTAYIYGLVGLAAGNYETDSNIYEKIVGYYDYNRPVPVTPWQEVELTSADFAASPFGFAMKGESWRMAFTSLWNRHKIDSMTTTRQVNNTSLTANGGYILKKGPFTEARVKPYFGGFWRGNWTKAENVENGVIGIGFGPDLGVVIAPMAWHNSYATATVGYHYKKYMLTGPKFEDPNGNDPPTAPHWNYTCIPEGALPASGGAFFVDVRSTLQFHRRVGAEAQLRYELDLGDSFPNGFTFAAGPSFWL